MANIIAVGLDGAICSILRYTISLIPYKYTFPLLTLITNICEVILIGYITRIAVKKDISVNAVLF